MFLLNFNYPFLNLEFFILFLFKHFINMSIKSILNLVQQSQRMLDTAGPQLIKESNKKIVETKHKISSESFIKQMMMDEITSNDPELVCNIETKNRIDSVYNKLKSNEVRIQNNLNNTGKLSLHSVLNFSFLGFSIRNTRFLLSSLGIYIYRYW